MLLFVRPASAQLVAAKEGPIVYGHHHLNTTNVTAQKKFFVDTLGGTAITVGTNNLEIVKFPNVLIFFSSSRRRPAAHKERLSTTSVLGAESSRDGRQGQGKWLPDDYGDGSDSGSRGEG